MGWCRAVVPPPIWRRLIKTLAMSTSAGELLLNSSTMIVASCNQVRPIAWSRLRWPIDGVNARMISM